MSQSMNCVHSQKQPHTWGAPVLPRTERDVLTSSVGPGSRQRHVEEEQKNQQVVLAQERTLQNMFDSLFIILYW